MAVTVDNNGTPVIITGTTNTDDEVMGENIIVFIKFIRWYNATTSGDLCNITDGNGRNIITMRADKDNHTQIWPIYTQFHGIRCDDLDSGTVQIFTP